MATMSFLTGLLIGSLKKIWPWKEILESRVIRGKVRVIKDSNILPESFNMEVVGVLAIMFLGLLLVLGIYHFSNRKQKITDEIT